MEFKTLDTYNNQTVNYCNQKCKYYSNKKKYNNIYNTYTNCKNKSGYVADVFKKNCKYDQNYNTIIENYLNK